MKPAFPEPRIIQILQHIDHNDASVTVVQKVYINKVGDLFVKWKGTWQPVAYIPEHGWSVNMEMMPNG